MTLRYRHKTNGKTYELKRYDSGYHIVLPVYSVEDFERLAKIAHGARMVADGESQANVISFDNVEKI
jgi:hypothetical protein